MLHSIYDYATRSIATICGSVLAISNGIDLIGTVGAVGAFLISLMTAYEIYNRTQSKKKMDELHREKFILDNLKTDQDG